MQNKRKYDVEEINLKVENVVPFKHEGVGGVVITWSSTIGFGQYTLIAKTAPWDAAKWIWAAQTETMDNEEDKAFGRKLLELWLKQIFIVE